jgi:poly-gamma-glutamate capsule biosynthesis protein CapA/YwtB (metallophosphatase superfamily)
MKETITLFLCGDVMTGRGIDQILPSPCDPQLHESYVQTASAYVALAEEANGPIPRPAPLDYIWGDALEELERAAPDLRIVNLETAVTRSDDWWPDKGIHYRMSPENAPSLAAARLDACSLANNHVLDWGYAGLSETLATLQRLGIRVVGAGRDLAEAAAPAVLEVPTKGRVLLFALGLGTSGIPSQWCAAAGRPGVNRLAEFSAATLRRISSQVQAVKKEGDVAVASVHWGGNWGYAIPPVHQDFAHALIDQAGIDLVHGHSSHHVLGIEVHRGKLILYGCGDFLTDYEGISGYEAFRGDLALMYFPRVRLPEGRLDELRMVPTRMHRFRITRASASEAAWLHAVLNRQGKALGTGAELREDGSLHLRWN